ncbi:nucleotide disphospho-sugar-binding domain-containing protein [Thermodesulfobacteriota bacterium]
MPIEGKSRRRKKKLLMIADANYLAHVSRILEIAKVLRSTGRYDITIAGDGKFMKLPKDAGFELDKVFTVAREKTLEYARRAGLVSYSWWSDIVYRSIESDMDCLRRNKPDLVVGDLHWSLSASCKMMDVPYISVTNAHWTRHFGCKIRGLDDHITTNLLGKRLGGMLLNHMKKYLLYYWTIPYKLHGRKNNLPTKHFTSLYDIIEGDMTLLADIPEYGVTKDIPPQVKYVGPILWEPTLPDPEWLSKLDRERPTFYFTMGSTGSSKFFDEAVRIFGDTQYQILITSGGLPLNIGTIPNNCYIEEFAPGRRLMEVSDVAVNHGGNGTVYQALISGTPIVGIPSHVDQELNLQRVEDLGFGLKLSPKKLSTQKFINAMELVLNDRKFKQNAMRLKSIAEQYNGAHTAATYIQEYLN